MIRRALVYSTSRYQYFGDVLGRFAGFEPGKMERREFPDGERAQRLTEPVRDRRAVVIGGTVDEEETLELFDLACGLIQYGAEVLTLVVPYYGYSTMERAVRPGEIVTAKTRALLLSSIPEARVCNEIVLVDLHTAGIAHYFEGRLRPYHMDTKKLFTTLVKEFDDFPNLIIASTDAGRAKWVEALANHLGVPAAFVYKQRLDGRKTTIRGINADVEGKHVVIYDDMIRTGGSLIKAGEAYKENGASKLTVLATHGVFPDDAMDRIYASGLFERVIVTDTHPRVMELQQKFDDDFLVVKTLIPQIATFLVNRDSFDY